MPHAFIRYERSMVWLAPAGFAYYLPAWLCVACRDGDVREPMLFNLRNYPEWIRVGLADPSRDRLGLGQLSAVVLFLVYWAREGDRFDAVTAREALDYWSPRLAAARATDP